MTKLPVWSGENAIRAFVRNGVGSGWSTRKSRDLDEARMPVVLTIPLHRELGPGLLRSLIRKAGLTVDEFQSLFQ